MLKFLARILLAIPGWIAYLVPMALLILLGFLIVPIAALSRSYKLRESDRYVDRKTLQFHDGVWMYCNEEDGIDGAANGFWPSTGRWPITRWEEFKQIVAWSAWRNSVGNARWLPFFGMTIADPKDMVVYLPQPNTVPIGIPKYWYNYRKTGPYLARYGWRFELRFPWPTFRCSKATCGACDANRRIFWIGWRIAQQDTPNTGVGFAFQPWSKL